MANNPNDPSDTITIPAVETLLAIGERVHVFLESIPQAEVDFTTSLVMSERIVVISGRYDPLEAPSRPEPIGLPDLRNRADYDTVSCKHECVVLKQSRHVRQAHDL